MMEDVRVILKLGLIWQKLHLTRGAFFSSTLDLKLLVLVKRYIWSIWYETWTLRAADPKHLEKFEMWCWRRMEKISWTDHVRN
jgi:hypothetical protein